MERKFFYNRERKLSYLDFGGKDNNIIALHGHFACAASYAKLQQSLPNCFRFIALDQQGHGFSDFGTNYTREEYISDILALYKELHIDSAIIIGFDLGAVNAYQFAAQYPHKVKALVIEDTGVLINNDISFANLWPTDFASLELVYDFLHNQGINNYMYFMQGIQSCDTGFKFSCDINNLGVSQQNLNGKWLQDWNKLSCPALLMRGENSNVLNAKQALAISKDKDNIAYIEFANCGHYVKDDNFEEYKNSIIDFFIALNINCEN